MFDNNYFVKNSTNGGNYLHECVIQFLMRQRVYVSILHIILL